LVVVCALQTLGAEPFPATKPIRIIVPTGPGGPPDIISRVIATELSDSEGWATIVEKTDPVPYRPSAWQMS